MNGDVQFKEEWRPQQFVPKKGWGEKLAGFIVKYSGGLIKNETQASYVIIGLVAVAIIISLFLFFGGGISKSENPGTETFKNAPSEMVPLKK
jgi:hypothetical protein